MDNKDIDKLMKQYLNFYQNKSKPINMDLNNDFDNLMNAYKTKFDEQIAHERLQYTTHQKKKTNPITNGQPINNKPPITPPKQTTVHKKEYTKPRLRKVQPRTVDNYQHHGFFKWIIIGIIIIIGGCSIFGAISTNDYFSDNNIIYLETDNNDAVDINHLADCIYLTDQDLSLKVANYLSYEPSNNDYQIYQDDNTINIDNNSSMYLYVNYNDTSILIPPYGTYYQGLNSDLVTLNNVSFYSNNYPLPNIDSTYIGEEMELSSDYESIDIIQEIMKYWYYDSLLQGNLDMRIFIHINNEISGYYGYYNNDNLSIYHTDDLNNYYDFASENIQKYESELVSSIPL